MVFEQVQSDLENEGYEVQPYIIPACAVDAPHRRDRVWFVAHRRDAQNTLGDGFVREPRNGEEKSNKWQQRMPCAGDSEWICDEERIITSDGSHAGSEILQRERAIGICESAVPADTPCNGRGGERPTPRRTEHRNILLPNEPQGCEVRSEPIGCVSERAVDDSQSPRLSPRSPRQRRGEVRRGDSRAIWRWDFSKFPTQSPVCGGDDGLSDRLDACPVPEWLKVNKRWRFSGWWRRESIKAYGNAVVPQIPYLIFQTIEQYTNL